MTKTELRTVYLEKRKKLSEEECSHLNVQLYNLFFSSIDLSFIKVLHTYLPMVNNHEPDTWPIIDRIRREFPHVRISLPRIKSDGNLESVYFEGLHQLEANSWGIQEPKQGVLTPAEKIDMVIVPLLAFDQTGQRVGYGKGFYDRLLNTCRIDCKKVGLSFFPPVDTITDLHSGDIPLTSCLEPSRAHYFGADHLIS
jgi:5-formyltetrahydrofolate cyclo-ligase